jgi:adenine deaminase
VAKGFNMAHLAAGTAFGIHWASSGIVPFGFALCTMHEGTLSKVSDPSKLINALFKSYTCFASKALLLFS